MKFVFKTSIGRLVSRSVGFKFSVSGFSLT